MRRRRFLRSAAGLAAGTALAGCSTVLETRELPAFPPVPEDRPDGAVYYPSHWEAMGMGGGAKRGGIQAALSYSYPHRFWTVERDGDGWTTSKQAVEDAHDVHLMVRVLDAETETVLPDLGVTLEITKGGDLVSEEVVYPMLSQRMGFHHGANFALDGDGTYEVAVSVGGTTVATLGAFAGRFDAQTTVPVTFEYSRDARDDLGWETLDEKAGEPGAVDPMTGGLPNATLPPTDELPGTEVGNASSDDVQFHVRALRDRFDRGPYLACWASTPYNRMLLPKMGLSATLTRDGETLFDDALQPAVGPDLQLHYGAFVDAVQTGDDLAVTVDAPPLVARHEGYETAFLDVDGFDATV
jgi:hypothetical protein